MLAADVDGDGDIDLLTDAPGIANTLESFAPVLLNDGAGTFTVQRQFGVSSIHKVADFDGDGAFDALTLNISQTFAPSLPLSQMTYGVP